MAKYFQFPFAVTGQKTAIPETTQANGAVSYQEGYGSDYSEDPASTPGARNIERVMFNQALFDITSTLQLYYQTAVPPYITAEQNGGTAFAYQENARVFFNGRIYESTIANNTNLPTVSAAWTPVDLTGLDARFAQLANLGTASTRNIGTAPDQVPLNSQLPPPPTLGTAAQLNTGTGQGQIPVIGPSSVLIATGTNSNGTFFRWSNNYTVQATPARTLSAGQQSTFNWPIAFTNRCLGATCEDLNRNDSVLNVSFRAAPSSTQFFPSNSGGGSSKTYWVWGFGN